MSYMGRPYRRQPWLHSDSPLCFWLQDEISTGLDSSTTFLITKCIRNFVHMQDVRTSKPGRPMLPTSSCCFCLARAARKSACALSCRWGVVSEESP